MEVSRRFGRDSAIFFLDARINFASSFIIGNELSFTAHGDRDFRLKRSFKIAEMAGRLRRLRSNADWHIALFFEYKVLGY